MIHNLIIIRKLSFNFGTVNILLRKNIFDKGKSSLQFQKQIRVIMASLVLLMN
jgi:hypothetical protein